MARKPHIVIFNPDQWRGDVLAHMGHPAAVTPNLDRLAREDGVSFRHAFCQNPVCTPSRCSFMTGWYPHVRGHRTMSYMLRDDEPCLLSNLKDSGYFVWWGGKNDLIGAQRGFDRACDLKYAPPAQSANIPKLRMPEHWRGPKDGDNYFSFYVGKLEGDSLSGRHTDGDWGNVRGAVDLIQNYDGDKPLCIYLPLGYPHPPYAAEDPWYSMIDRKKVPPRAPLPTGPEPAMRAEAREIQRMHGWSDDRWVELQATYYASCARVDHQFGMVTDALREAGMYDDTAVFFFSDHGDYTGDYNLVQKADNVFPDCLSRVPFAIKPPADVNVAPRVSEALVELIDFPATVEALAGIEPSHTHFGKSLLPVIAGETDEHRDAVFCEGGRRYGEKQAMATELVPDPVEDNIYWSVLKQMRTESPAMGKAVMVRTHDHKYVARLYEDDEFYDLKNDPQEVHNRIHDPAYAETIAALRERLMRFYLDTADVVAPDLDARTLGQKPLVDAANARHSGSSAPPA